MQAAKALFLFSASVLALALTATLLGVRVELPETAYADTGHEYKSVFVPAPVNDGEGERGWIQIDEKEFLGDLRLALNQLSYEGFEVVEVTPIVRGRLDPGGVRRHGTWGGGYTVTQGVVIIAKKSSG